ncbi:MAG: HAD family hydrolase [Solirubrobacteraceae bacterium]
MTHVLFWDIDGTLLTTGRAGIFALEQAAQDVCGIEVDLQSMPTSGLTDSQIAARVIEDCGQEASAERVGALLRAYERHLPERLGWRRGRVLPGVHEILEDVAIRPGVVSLLLTGNTRAGAAAKLAHYGLDGHLFDGGFCADTDDRDAIARRAWQLAAEREGGEVVPERTYVVGDTPHDVACARAIGARAVAVASGSYGRDELEAAGPWLLLDALPEPERFAALLGLPPRARDAAASRPPAGTGAG